MSQGQTLHIGDKSFSVTDITQVGYWRRLPYCLRVLLENALRNDGEDAIATFAKWFDGESPEVAFYPARVLMQDLTGVPAMVDLTAMRDAMADLGGDPSVINPKCGVDLVIDHSVTVDYAMGADAFAKNVAMEVSKNKERYELLKWAQASFDNVRIVPPGKGICHQVNLEYLADVVTLKQERLYPDTLVGLDSHTTMINGLGVLGWGVGGIEAEAAMLGQPVSLNIPKVVGVKLVGGLNPGVTATDLVLSLTEYLRGHGVVGSFVEFFGKGASELSLAERATISNMSPEFGATCAYFPIDKETLAYLSLTGRGDSHVERIEAYLKHMSMWWDLSEDPDYTTVLAFDLSQVEACVSGPKRPEQRLALSAVKPSLGGLVYDTDSLSHGSVVIAAITSCTNTSNPSVLIGAGLLAKNAIAKGLKLAPWVKASFAPGSRVVVDYLKALDLIEPLEALGFYLVGFGCTTCIGNSGPLDEAVAKEITERDLTVSAVLSGNRNFEGRVHPQTQLNYLASPGLVVAYALSGNVGVDLQQEPIGYSENKPIYLKDIWPSDQEVQQAMQAISSEMFVKEYQDIFSGTIDWENIDVVQSPRFQWRDHSTYIRHPSFLAGVAVNPLEVDDIKDARILALLGDSVTTDHISPAGTIAKESEAANYLRQNGIEEDLFHSYGARRGNAEVMVRGTFANIRLDNKMSQRLGGYTTYHPAGEETSIYDCAMRYHTQGVQAVVFAGKYYGTGSSRDWAAKGTKMLGVRAVIAESFERIHRSNLLGMGVLPCILASDTLASLNLSGDELVSLTGIHGLSKPRATLVLSIQKNDTVVEVPVIVAIDTQTELGYFQHGGILPYVLRGISA